MSDWDDFKNLSGEQIKGLHKILDKYAVDELDNEKRDQVIARLKSAYQGFNFGRSSFSTVDVNLFNQFIILINDIKPGMALDFLAAVVKYLWSKPAHYERRSNSVHFEYHYVVNGSPVISHAWFQVSATLGIIVFKASHDMGEDKDALSDAGDSDYDDEIHTRGGLRSMCAIVRALHGRISVLERGVGARLY